MDIALHRILNAIEPVPGQYSVVLEQSQGRIVAEDILSPLNVPPHHNAAMDGFALRGQDIPDSGDKTFYVVGDAFAGHPYDGVVGENESVRIMTGAPLPTGTDTVVMQERAVHADHKVTISSSEQKFQNTRAKGEDIKKGSVVMSAGIRLGAAEAGILASVGIAQIQVKPKLKIALISTGDELCQAGEPLESGQIYDSNRPLLTSLLHNLGFEVLDLGIVRDHRESIDKILQHASTDAQAIITTGGASTGVADYVSEAMREIGELGVWRIALRPGRPFGFGQLNETHFFSLPGNPVAVMTTFYALVQPALRKLAGESDLHPVKPQQARLSHDLRKKSGRVEYYRGVLSQNNLGENLVSTTGRQGSGMLHSMHVANCFIVLGHDEKDKPEGQWVNVHPFHGVFG